jgi:hypothetical protein
MLFVVVYNILIKNTKMSLNKGNLVEGFAARTATFIKNTGRLEEFGLENSSAISSLKISEESVPDIAIKLLLEAIIPVIFEEFITGEIINKENNIINISTSRYANKIKNLPNIILIRNGRNEYFKELPFNLEIKFEDVTEDYSLESGIIRVGGVHAIAGLLCNDVPYIYDSNNVIAISDWSNNKYEAYLNALREKGIDNYAQNIESMEGVSSVIYIKNSFKKDIDAIISNLESNKPLTEDQIEWIHLNLNIEYNKTQDT